MNLAIASIRTSMDIELYQTSREDVRMYTDMLLDEPKRYANVMRF